MHTRPLVLVPLLAFACVESEPRSDSAPIADEGFVVHGELPAGVDVRAHLDRIPPGGFGVIGDPVTGETATVTRASSPFARIASGEFDVLTPARCLDCGGDCTVNTRTIEMTLGQRDTGPTGARYITQTFSSSNFLAPSTDPAWWPSSPNDPITLTTTGTLGTCSVFSYYFDVVEDTAACDPGPNLIQNPGFEDFTVPCTDQNCIGSPWVNLSFTADTHSNDGSYGLFPSDFNNFTGVVAHGGIRWAAAWGAPPESFGQDLPAALVAGETYVIGGWFHPPFRQDLGTVHNYAVDLDSPNGSLQVGTFEAVDPAGTWQFLSFTFVAPVDADERTRLVLRAENGYPGVDDLELNVHCADAG